MTGGRGRPEYRLIAKKGEGTFSEVLKAQCVKNGKMTAIKCMKSQFESEEQVNNLREIQALRRLSPHPGIIKLVEVLYEQPTGRLALVFELMDMNIYELIRGRRQYLPEARIKSYMYQLIKAMDHMHRNGIFHRDIKPENILIADEVLKLADFGSCRGIYSKQPYTEYISTRWYRAPECLLTDGYYNYKMDLWGVGCVFFEIVSLYPLFPGNNELDQIHKIHNILGTPPPDVLEKFKRHATHMELNFPPKEGSGISKLIPHALEDCNDLILKLLAYNPEDRLSARQALRHAYVRELREMDKKAKRDLLAQNQAQLAPSGISRGPTSSSQQSGEGAAPSARRSHRDDGSEHGGGRHTQRGLPTIGNSKVTPSSIEGLIVPQPSHHAYHHHHYQQQGHGHGGGGGYGASHGGGAGHAAHRAERAERYATERDHLRDPVAHGAAGRLAGGALPELTGNSAMRVPGGHKGLGPSGKKHGTFPKKQSIKGSMASASGSKYGTGSLSGSGLVPSARHMQIQGTHNFTGGAGLGGQGVLGSGRGGSKYSQFSAYGGGGAGGGGKYGLNTQLATGPMPPGAKYTSPYSQKKS